MTKNLLVTFLIACCSVLVAQKSLFHFNLGPALSQIDGDELGGYKKLGYNIGGGFIFKKSSTYEIDYSLRLNQKGARETRAYNIPLNYAESDISFNYIYKDFLYAGAGFGLGYLANSAENRSVNANITLTRLDIFPLINLGFKATDRINIQTRFTRSLLPVTVGGLKQGGFKWYNRSVLIEAVFLFPR